MTTAREEAEEDLRVAQEKYEIYYASYETALEMGYRTDFTADERVRARHELQRAKRELEKHNKKGDTP